MFDDLKKKNGTLLGICRNILRKHKSVIIQCLTAGFLEMTKNWICNVECLGILSNVLFITTDLEVYKELLHFNSKINIIHIEYTTLKSIHFGQAGYWKYMVFRVGIIRFLLRNEINVFITESDAVWLQNPMPLIENDGKFDIIAQVDNAKRNFICGGFLYLNCTGVTRQVWGQVFQGMENAVMDWDDSEIKDNQAMYNDQRKLNKAIKRLPVRVRRLPIKRFSNYDNWDPDKPSQPFVIQNNWIIGNENKIARAKRFDHWFLTDSHNSESDSEDDLVLREVCSESSGESTDENEDLDNHDELATTLGSGRVAGQSWKRSYQLSHKKKQTAVIQGAEHSHNNSNSSSSSEDTESTR
ncbi:uncharacterized protein LOC144359421 [Saccoglossus kowalevskii]